MIAPPPLQITAKEVIESHLDPNGVEDLAPVAPCRAGHLAFPVLDRRTRLRRALRRRLWG